MENREVEHLVGKYKEWPKISNSSFFNMENCSNGVKEIYSQIDINRLMENPESKNDFLQLLRPILSKGYIERLALPGNEEEKEMFLEDINTLICSINYLSPVQIRSIVSVIEDPYGIHSQFHRDHMRILYDIAFGEESDVIKDEKIEKIAFYITNPCWRNLRENIEDLEFLAKRKGLKNFQALLRLADNDISTSSPHHYEDMILLGTTDNPLDVYQLATNEEVLSHPDYREVIKLIASQKEEYFDYDRAVIKLIALQKKEPFDYEGHSICDVAQDKNAMKSPYYLMDLKLIAEAETLEKKKALGILSTNEASLSSLNHYSDMQYIANAEDKNIVPLLLEVATSQPSLDKKDNTHIEDMKLIANAKDPKIADCLKEIAVNEESLKSEHHREDMELVASIGDYEVAPVLKNIIIFKHLKGKKGRKARELVANAGENVASMYYIMAMSQEKEQYSEIKRLMASTNSRTKIDLIDDFICNELCACSSLVDFIKLTLEINNDEEMKEKISKLSDVFIKDAQLGEYDMTILEQYLNSPHFTKVAECIIENSGAISDRWEYIGKIEEEIRKMESESPIDSKRQEILETTKDENKKMIKQLVKEKKIQSKQ